MFTLTRKGLWAHKVRFALTGLAVVLGVAFMAGTTILTDTMGRTFDDLFASANAEVDVVVQRSDEIDGDFVGVRERVDASVIDTIKGVAGVDGVAGSVQGLAQLVRDDGTAQATNGIGGTLGTNWIDDERLNPFRLASGTAPGTGQVVLDKATVEREGWALGDTVTVLGKAAPMPLTLVGIATFGAVDGIPGSSMVATDTPTAQLLFGTPGAFDTVTVAADSATTPSALAAAIAAALGDPSLEVMTGEADTAADQEDLRESLGFFNDFLLAFAYIALFVGTFIIYNTFSIVVAQRTREMAMLRAIGAGRRQLVRAILLESAIVGAVASAVGLVLGVAVSFALRSMLAGVGLEIPNGEIVISSSTVRSAFIVGVLVTVLSSVVPALRAGRIAPMAALRDAAVDRAASSLARTVIGLAIAGGGAALFAAGIAGGTDGLPTLGLGVVVIVLGIFVLGPVIARPAMHALGAVAPRVSGTVGALARQNAKRNPKRTAATAAALMIGVALVGFITIVASSSKASVRETIDHSLRADYVVDSGSWGGGGLSPALAAELATVPGVDAVVPLRSSPVVDPWGSTGVRASDMSAVDRVMELDVVAGSFADVHGDGVAILSDHAATHDLAIGDPVVIRFPATGEVTLTVRALFDGDAVVPGDGPYLLGLDTYEANVTDQYDLQVFVTTVDGVDAATSSAALQKVLDRWPNAALQDQAAFKESVTSQIDQMLNLIYGLLGLAVLIALIGIANTLALSVHERTRELGLLRAVGMTRRQVRTAIRWESVLIALLGTALGFVIAVGGAWGLVTALGAEDDMAFVVPGVRLLTIVAIAAIAATLAALGPARRAARLDVLDAIAR